jgi:hypothetical protein
MAGAVHVDLYDRTDVIPFDRITEFFNASLHACKLQCERPVSLNFYLTHLEFRIFM